MIDTGRAARLVNWLLGEQPNTTTRPIADAQQQQALHENSLGVTARLVQGLITDATPLAHCYKVQVEKGMPTMVAMHASQTSLQTFGAKQLNTLQPGTLVLLVIPPRQVFGIIIAVLPTPMSDPRSSLIDTVSQAGRSRVDAADRKPFNMPGNGGVIDWTAGRPFDSTLVGEAGWITETGLRFFIDPFMVQMAVDEVCGVTGFYHDQLLRIAAYNLQLITAGSVREAFNDQAEYNEIVGYTPYPWEQLGLFEPGDPFKENDPQKFQIDEPYYSMLEPKEDKQRPFHRELHFHGYLGQGGKTMIFVPPKEPETAYLYGTTQAPIALYDSSRSLAGHQFTRSATGILISKRGLIPAPNLVRRPEDPQGDTEENYKFAGVEGSGEEHSVKGGMGIEGDDISKAVVRAAGAEDESSYLFNWVGMAPFYYHKKDWKVDEESAVGQTSGLEKVQEIPDFAKLKEEQYLDPPEPKKVKVDPRMPEVDIYPNESFFHLLPDGGIVISDGFGGEIKMTGGHVEINAPGGVWLKSGKNVNIFAGFDAIIRAKNSCDITVSEKDIRLKAEKNMQLLAGNGGQGGLLLESRARGQQFDFANKTGEDVVSAGIMLRAPESDVISWANNVYLRTGGGEIQPGIIVLDAAKGEQPIMTHAIRQEHYTREGVWYYLGQAPDVEVTYEFAKTFCSLGAPTGINGFTIIDGGLLTKNSISVAEGHIGTSQAKSFQNFVGEVKGEGLQQAISALSAVDQRITVELPQRAVTLYNQVFEERYYTDNKPGNDDVIDQVAFSLRSKEQYKAENFALFEARWQQMARLGGKSVASWEEKPVETGSDTNYPYPGGSENYEQSGYRKLDLVLFDMAAGYSKDRGDLYADPKHPAPQEAGLNEYTVIQ